MASGSAVRAGKAFVEFFVEDSRIERGLKSMERRFQFFGRRLSNISRRALQFGGGATAALLFPLRGFKEFDDKIKELESLATRGATSLQELREQAKQLGRDTSFTAIDVGGGMTEMARAGFNTDEIKGGIADVMNLARATQSAIPRATEIAAGTLRAFNLPIEDMTRVVNVAVASVNKSAIGIEDYAESMKYAAPVARMYGMSVEETSKAIAVLGNFQIKGSLAGTALRNAMMRVADPTIRKSIEKFTPVIDQASGRIKDISQIMRELGTATAGEDAARKLDRLSLMTEVFGLRSAAGAIVLSENVAQGFDEAFNDPEFAAKISAHMDSGIGGALRRLSSMWEGVSIAFGEATQGMIIKGAEWLTRFLSVVREMIDKNPKLAQVVLASVLAITALGLAGLVAGYLVRGLGFSLGLLANTLNVVKIGVVGAFKAIAWLTTTLLAVNPVALVLIALLAGLAAWFVYASGAVQAMSAFLRDSFATAWSTIVRLVAAGELQAAFALAMALIKTTWTIGISALKVQWIEFTSGLSVMLLDGIATAEIAWLNFTTFIADTFDSAIGKLVKKWREVQDWLAEKILLHMEVAQKGNKYNQLYGGAKANEKYIRDQQDLLQTLREDQARRGDPEAAAQNRIAARQEATDAKRTEIEQRVAAEKEAAKQAADASVSGAQAEANSARAAFDQAQAKANDQAAAAEGGAAPDGEKPKTMKEIIEELMASLGNGPKTVASQNKANTAVTVQSKEGQELIAKALGYRSDSDKITEAIAELQGAVVNQLEDLQESQEELATNLDKW